MKLKNKVLLAVLVLAVFITGYELGVYVSNKHGPGRILKTENQICPADKPCYFEPTETREIIYGSWIVWFDNNSPEKYISINDIKTGINYRLTRSNNKEAASELDVSKNELGKPYQPILLMRDISNKGDYTHISYSIMINEKTLIMSQDYGMDGTIDKTFVTHHEENDK